MSVWTLYLVLTPLLSVGPLLTKMWPGGTWEALWLHSHQIADWDGPYSCSWTTWHHRSLAKHTWIVMAHLLLLSMLFLLQLLKQACIQEGLTPFPIPGWIFWVIDVLVAHSLRLIWTLIMTTESHEFTQVCSVSTPRVYADFLPVHVCQSPYWQWDIRSQFPSVLSFIYPTSL